MDRREEIIARLFEIVSGRPWVNTAERNRIEFDDTQLPAVSVLEGDEEVLDDTNKTRAAPRPYLVDALPQVFIRTIGGTELNSCRADLIKAIEEDEELRELTVNNRGARFIGQQANALVARNILGAIIIIFSARYRFLPSEV